jgi:integrase
MEVFIMAATEPIRNKHQIRELAEYFLRRGELRNQALVVLGVRTALRISDLLRLKWEDVYDFERGHVRASLVIAEKKTGKTKTVALHKSAVRALALFASRAAKRGGFLIENSRTGKAISRIQAYRLIRAAADLLDIGRVSCHSLRKTFGYHTWKSGVSPAVIMEIYNHNSLAVTRRYLGVSQDDKNEVYMGLKLLA